MEQSPNPPQESSAERALRIAKEDLLGRIATQSPGSPDLDMVIAALDKIALDERRAAQEDEYWDAQYVFYNRLITEEVERFRLGEGYEPVHFDLYPNFAKQQPNEHDYLGTTQIGRRKFYVVARRTFDQDGIEVIRVEVTAQKPTKAEEAALWARGSKRLYNQK